MLATNFFVFVVNSFSYKLPTDLTTLIKRHKLPLMNIWRLPSFRFYRQPWRIFCILRNYQRKLKIWSEYWAYVLRKYSFTEKLQTSRVQYKEKWNFSTCTFEGFCLLYRNTNFKEYVLMVVSFSNQDAQNDGNRAQPLNSF